MVQGCVPGIVVGGESSREKTRNVAELGRVGLCHSASRACPMGLL